MKEQEELEEFCAHHGIKLTIIQDRGWHCHAELDDRIFKRSGLTYPELIMKCFLKDLQNYLEAKWSASGT